MRNLKILLVENDQVLRECIKVLASNKSGYEIIANLHSCEELLESSPTTNPDILLIDYPLAKSKDFNPIKRYTWDFPYTKLIAVGCGSDDDCIFKLVENGFKGCISKERIEEELDTAIKVVMQGSFFCNFIN